LVQADLPRFAGSEKHALDNKGRLIVPARFRDRLGERFVLTVGHPDPCLALYPTQTWVEISRRLEAPPRKEERDQYRRFLRYIFAHTEEVACDNQGRVVIPARLRAYAAIDKKIVSVGMLTRIEIWAEESYNVESVSGGEVADFMADLGLY
jgi:MraZ protein